MSASKIIRSELFPESIVVSVPNNTRQLRTASTFIFAPAKERPSTSERCNISERFAWVGSCLTRFAASIYIGNTKETRRRLEDACGQSARKNLVLDEYQKESIFDFPPRERRLVNGEGHEDWDTFSGFRPSLIADAGSVLHDIGGRLQTFNGLEDTIYTDLSDTNEDYFVDRFTRQRTPAVAARHYADEITTTILTSRSPAMCPHYIAETTYSGNRCDAQTRFSYSATFSSSREVPSLLTVTGSLEYGPNDYRDQNITFASLVVAGMRMQRMAMLV